MSIERDANGRNQVVSKMWEIASLDRFRHDRLLIRSVTTKEVVPDKRYQWNLYEKATDSAPVDTLTLDVDFSERLLIDDEIGQLLDSERRRESGDK